MTTTTENQAIKTKQAPNFIIFENGAEGKTGKPAGAGFAHKKGNGFTFLIGGKRYAVFPTRTKSAAQPAATEGEGA